MIKGVIFDLHGVLFDFEEGGEPVFKEENIFLVKKMSEKYHLAVLSNASIDYKEHLEKDSLIKYFKTVVLSGVVGFQKPEKEIFDIALNKMNLKPEEVIFIDDSIENIESGKAVGLNCILYKNVNQLKEELLSLGIEI